VPPPGTLAAFPTMGPAVSGFLALEFPRLASCPVAMSFCQLASLPGPMRGTGSGLVQKRLRSPGFPEVSAPGLRKFR